MTTFIFISDIHNYSIKLPEGDIVLFTGDATLSRNPFKNIKELELFIKWYSGLEYKYKVMIAGNHDTSIEGFSSVREKIVASGIIYLQNSGIELAGQKIWGSPYQPAFGGWAFNLPVNGYELENVWDKIPEDTDILMTHSPPFGILDRSIDGRFLGCELLLERVMKVKPKVHCFGHIHEAYGIKEKDGIIFINASICNMHYLPVNKPLCLEIEECV